MFKKLIIGLLLSICIISATHIILKPQEKANIAIGYANIDNMPIIYNPAFNAKYMTPQENRGEAYAKWLKCSFKISVGGGSGSGTLCYYDRSKNLAYVISCGHLWNGNMSANSRDVNATIITWYKNNTKLTEPKEYKAKVLFYSNRQGYDMSLLTFTPDWVPDSWFPIAPPNYPIPTGSKVHSMGCDGAREVAHYSVEIVNLESGALVTRYNSPRPGRSGGGLVDDAGYYIAICYATSDVSGEGYGYFTPIAAINELYEKEGFGFLLNLSNFGNLARSIKIKDVNNTQGKYDKEYIPLPKVR